MSLWLIGNDLDPYTVRWPLTVDILASTITLPPTQHSPALDIPLKRLPIRPLWRTLAEAGGLWCADPEHRDHTGANCRERVNHRGWHITSEPKDPQLCSHDQIPQPPNRATTGKDAPLELAITTALLRAAPGCEHPDPGQPIYDHTRACANCGAAAVIELFHTADTIHHLQQRALEQHGRPQPTADGLQEIGHWVVGHGHVPAGDPRANEWWLKQPASTTPATPGEDTQ